MNGLCPQRPGIVAPVDVMVLCKQQEKYQNSHTRFYGLRSQTCTQGWSTRRQTKRHFHWPGMWPPEFLDLPEEAGEMQSCKSAGMRAYVIEKQDPASCHGLSVPEESLKLLGPSISRGIIDFIDIPNWISRS